MASNARELTQRRLSAGRVFERAFGTLLHNPLVTLGLALVIGGLPSIAAAFYFSAWSADIVTEAQRPGFDMGTFMGAFWGVSVLSMIVTLAISALVLAVLTRATVAESEGRRASLGECLGAALPVILPLIGLSLLLAFGVGIGLVLLLVPGIMLYMMWVVAAPVLIEERRGIFGSFGRSRQLTRGARWKIFGIILVLVIIYYLLSAILSLTGMSGIDATPGAAPQLSPGFIIGGAVTGTLVNALWSTVQASLYVELRDWKDGPASENLEEVFA